MSILALDQVTKRFGGFTAVDDLSFTVPEGSIFGFLGPNGAGKTTTLRMVLDILQPTTGKITVLGRPNGSAPRAKIGFLPEERGLYKRMTVLDNVVYLAKLKGLSGRDARRRGIALLERFGLAPVLRRRLDSLSKGMAQKVQLIATVVHHPALILLDEPFSGLDPVNQQVLEDLVRELARDGATIIFSTHVMQHAERLCDRLLLLGRGQKRFEGDLAAARQTLPRAIKLVAGAGADGLAALPGVSALHPLPHEPTQPGFSAWELELAPGAETPEILKACFERRIPLLRFDQSEPSLHDIFVHLVGDIAVEVAER